MLGRMSISESTAPLLMIMYRLTRASTEACEQRHYAELLL
jgi:hypothetical protein